MATKLAVPRPSATKKVQPQETEIDASDLVEEPDNTEPSPPPVVVSAPPRPIAASLPSEYELESRRKSSPPVAERRRELTKYVASAVGVAWFICTCAIGETALRSLIASMH